MHTGRVNISSPTTATSKIAWTCSISKCSFLLSLIYDVMYMYLSRLCLDDLLILGPLRERDTIGNMRY